MITDPQLVEQIYEAALDASLWPAILQRLAEAVGAFGAAFLTHSPAGLSWIGSTKGEQVVVEYMEEGWWKDPYAQPLLSEMYPGFRSETAYRSIEEIEASQIHREFWEPRGLVAGAATVMQESKDDILHLTFEGFPSHQAAYQALPALDALRPHLARALSATSKMMATHQKLAVDAIGLAGVPAAIVGRSGDIRASNDTFDEYMDAHATFGRRTIRFTDLAQQHRFETALHQCIKDREGRSIAVKGTSAVHSAVLHLSPVVGTALRACGADSVLALVASGKNDSIPNSDMLRLLFDLTATEARLARSLAEGASLAAAAEKMGIAFSTARVHLRSVFAKAGVNRQAELVVLLQRFSGS